MKLNVNIFNELNNSFNDEFKTKKQVIIESNKVTTEDIIKEAAPQPTQSGNIAPEPVVNQTTADVEVKDEVTPTEEENKEINESTTDVNEATREYKEAYGKDLNLKTVPCVIAIDKFLSGWGGAEGKTHYQVVLCDDNMEAHNIAYNMKSEADKEGLSKIRISFGVKLPSEASVSYVVGRYAPAWNMGDKYYEKKYNKDKEVKPTEENINEEENKDTEEINENKDMHFYLVTLKHDNGKVKLKTTASSKEQAIKSILKSENAPESAVVKVEDLGPVLKEEKCDEEVKPTEEENENDIQKLLDEYKGKYVDYEFYEYIGKNKTIHTDTVKSIDINPAEYKNYKVEDYELMTESDYEHSILANSSVTADFKDWYGITDSKILVIIVKSILEESINEEEIIQLPNTDLEPDYIISDVTVLNQISDGDVQSPDIEGLLTLVTESLSNKYGEWGKINILSTNKINENSSYALVDITTKELVEEFKNRGIQDGAIGKNLIVESANGLVEFKVNNLNGTTTFSKKSDNPASIIEEWVESEFLSEAKAEKEKEAEITKAKNEKDTVEDYINNRIDLKMAISNIEMFIEMSKSIKDESFTKMVQNQIYGFVAELPHSIEVTNKDDKYELEFTNPDNIVEMLFGKEWVKEPTEDNKVVGIIKESYEQFNIGEIEVVFNPDTYETLYSIPSADVKDKKINLTKVPTVDTPYDTDTIIKSYVETKFGRIPTEEETKEPKEEIDVTDINVDTIEEPIGVGTEDEELHEDELPEEPDTNELQNTPDTTDEVEEVQNETGTARFVKIRPKQETNLAGVREKIAENDTPESSYIVVDTKDLLPEEWEDLTNNLNKTQSYLSGIQSLDRKNYSFNVVKLTSSGAGYSLLVDPLGYGYPRYLAIDENV